MAASREIPRIMHKSGRMCHRAASTHVSAVGRGRGLDEWYGLRIVSGIPEGLIQCL